jgi:hypothetical protein
MVMRAGCVCDEVDAAVTAADSAFIDVSQVPTLFALCFGVSRRKEARSEV